MSADDDSDGKKSTLLCLHSARLSLKHLCGCFILEWLHSPSRIYIWNSLCDCDYLCIFVAIIYCKHDECVLGLEKDPDCNQKHLLRQSKCFLILYFVFSITFILGSNSLKRLTTKQKTENLMEGINALINRDWQD